MNQSNIFKIGQLYKSKGEPELGLGHIVTLEDKTITILFPKSQESRTYNVKNAPLQRIVFVELDQVYLEGQHKVIITKVEGSSQEHIIYHTKHSHFHESSIIAAHDDQNVVYRFLDGEWDSPSFFQLRFETRWHQKRLQSKGPWGLLGPRINLWPHQLYIANTVTQRPHPRVLLADEVGLGKTIEAGLIIHKLLTTKAISRVLIVPPAPLVNQWFTEMHHLFNLSFHVVEEEGTAVEDDEDLTWDNLPLVITSLDYLANKESRLEILFASEWDLLIIDEAHRLEWTKEGPSMAYELVESLAYRIPGLLLLSATPEQLGPQGHFARLRLLDPQRFHSFDEYLLESKNYHQVSNWIDKMLNYENWVAKDDALLKEFLGDSLFLQWSKALTWDDKIQLILEHCGPGRVYFRNTRKSLSAFGMKFPKRKLCAYPLPCTVSTPGSYDAIEQETSYPEKLDWIVQFLQDSLKQYPNKKFLVLTKLKKNVLAIEHRLHKVEIKDVGVFHSQMSHIQRDAQAQSFLQRDSGPRILLSTELGSEGRNFQKCADIILYDLPIDPDLVEQRIGRLDRLGQISDVTIHVPYMQNSYEELLVDWYDRGLHLFDATSASASFVFGELQKDLKLMLFKPKDFLHTQKWQHFITKTHQLDLSIKNTMEQGRDRLIEYQSFRPRQAQMIVDSIDEWEKSHYLEDYLDHVFHIFNIQQTDLTAQKDIFHIKPDDNMMMSAFPNLGPKGMSATFSRSLALEDVDIQFLSWDNEMISSVMDFITSNTLGNVSVCGTHKKQQFGNSPYLMEFIYSWNIVAPGALQTSRYVADQCVRVVVDASGKVLKSSIDSSDDLEEWQIWEDLLIVLKPTDLKLTSMTQLKDYLKKWPKDQLDKLVKKVNQWVNTKIEPVISANKDQLEKHFNHEIDRLVQLKKNNRPVRKEEITALEDQLSQIKTACDQTYITLDAMRLIILI